MESWFNFSVVEVAVSARDSGSFDEGPEVAAFSKGGWVASFPDGKELEASDSRGSSKNSEVGRMSELNGTMPVHRKPVVAF